MSWDWATQGFAYLGMAEARDSGWISKTGMERNTFAIMAMITWNECARKQCMFGFVVGRLKFKAQQTVQRRAKFYWSAQSMG